MENRNILIIEDEQKIADTLQFGLAENGYLSDVAYDGLVGHDFFKSRSYDLVILDINLPGMNGYELCKAIRTQNNQVPVIFLTALHSIDDKVDGYHTGADDYLVKPFEFRELLLKINVLIKRSAIPQLPLGNILRAADLEMNLDNREVKRDDQKLTLTNKEFQLLEYLLRNKNKVVSRADIAINVWDVDFDTNTNVIDVYINYVRNKIDKNFSTKLIQTHIGMGYILKDSNQ